MRARRMSTLRCFNPSPEFRYFALVLRKGYVIKGIRSHLRSPWINFNPPAAENARRCRARREGAIV